MRFSGVYWKIYEAAKKRPRYISNKGGTRSTKTYSTLQFLHLLIPAVDKAGDITSVVSESFPHLKKGAIRDFESIIGHPLKGDSHWNETEHTWTYDNGAKLEFFSADNSDKVHGSQRKRLFVNEANHIEWEIFRQMAVRTSSIIFLDYNPASVCWIQEKIECKENCILIKSTYKDNPFLSAEQVREIEDNKDDEIWWKSMDADWREHLMVSSMSLSRLTDYLQRVWTNRNQKRLMRRNMLTPLLRFMVLTLDSPMTQLQEFRFLQTQRGNTCMSGKGAIRHTCRTSTSLMT